MRPGLAGRLSRVLVGCHPRRWRERYGEEMLDVLGQHDPTARTVASMGASAVSAHLDPAWHTGRPLPPRLRRAALISALTAAPLMVFASTTSIRDVADSQPFIVPGDRVMGSPGSSRAWRTWPLP